jgi:hypothetical protein
MKRIAYGLLLAACTCTGCVWDAQGIFVTKEPVAAKTEPTPPPPQVTADVVNDSNAFEVAAALGEELDHETHKTAPKTESTPR